MHVIFVASLLDAPPSTHSYTDVLLAAFTGLLVVVGIFQWLLIRRQDKHFRNSERAWIIASPIELAPVLGFIPGPGDSLTDPGRAKRNVFMCAYKNTGRTPARLV